MAVKKIVLATVFLGLCVVSCTDVNKTKTESQAKDRTTISPQQNNMKSYISLFEIPAAEISRAITFYQTILDVKIEKIEMPDMQMGIFPYEGQMIQGIILKAQGSKPSADGVTIYLNGGDNLQVILDKVEKNGGKILMPKTAHADGNGYFAIFLDTEGNRIGLNSPN